VIYVLIEFRVSGRKKFYIGVVIKIGDTNGDIAVRFFRTISKKINEL
jgi:hypothetical protein